MPACRETLDTFKTFQGEISLPLLEAQAKYSQCYSSNEGAVLDALILHLLSSILIFDVFIICSTMSVTVVSLSGPGE